MRPIQLQCVNSRSPSRSQSMSRYPPRSRHSQLKHTRDAIRAHSTMISVCSLGKACKKAGSPEIARFLSDVAAMTTGLEVESVGCLGHCGKGPNIVVHQETGQHTVVHHIATPSDALELLRGLSSSLALSEVDVEAMSLRLQANQKAMSSDLDTAMDLYNKALTLKPSVGRHLIYCNRSALQLQKGFKEEALQDALDALDLDSKHVKSWIRAIDASYALERYSEAAEMFKLASEVTAFKSALEYKSIRFALAAKGQRL